jgi:sugar phosphate isomerase/epimerase
MKLGLSLTVALGKDKTLAGADKLSLEDLYLELAKKTIDMANKFSISHIELVSFPPFDAVVLKKIIPELKAVLDGFEVSYHLPAWEISSSALNEGVRQAIMKELKATIDIATELGVKEYCMHPASFSAMRWSYGWFVDKCVEQSRKSIYEINSYCQTKNAKLNIENIPLGAVYFTRPEHFKEFLNEDVGLVLDTAHAITVGVDPADFIRAFPEFIKKVHAVDGISGKEDFHPPMGEGEIDYKNFFNELQKISFAGPVIIEMMTEEDVKKSIEHLKTVGLI